MKKSKIKVNGKDYKVNGYQVETENVIPTDIADITGLQSALNYKQDKLTAGTNISIDANNVISASGGLQEVTASDVDSETATSGQVLTADGNGGASWQNASGGEKLYRHNLLIEYIDMNQEVYNFTFEIITSSNINLSYTTFLTFLINNGFTQYNFGLLGYYSGQQSNFTMIKCFCVHVAEPPFITIEDDNNISIDLQQNNEMYFTDIVTEI